MLAKPNLLPKLLNSFSLKRRPISTSPLPIPSPTSPILLDKETLWFSILDSLVSKGFYSSGQGVLRRIISRCGGILGIENAIKFAAKRGLGIDLETCGVVLRKLVDLDETQVAEGYYDGVIGVGFVSQGVGFDVDVLNTMVVCYCKMEKFDEAKREFGRVLKLSGFPCRAACVVMIRELCDRGCVLDAYGCFRICVGSNVVLGGRCFERLIYGLCDRWYLDEAGDVFDEMIRVGECRPVANLYKSLYYCACRKGRPVEAEQLGWEMESQGYFVDKKMYTSLIKGYCRIRELKMAMRVFFKMLKMSCEPDNYVCITLVDAFFKLGMQDKGWFLLDKMVELGNTPDVVTHQIVITEHCRKQRVDHAMTILNEMIAQGLSLNVQCFTPIIDALIKADRFQEVDPLCQNMLNCGVLPDHVFFFKLLKKWPRGKELDLACEVLRAIVQNGCGAGSSLIESASNMDLDRKVGYLLSCVTTSNLSMTPVAFGICISALCAGGKIDDAERFREKMVSLGYQPLLSTWNSLIKCVISLGRDADCILQHLRIHGMQPSSDTYQIVINGLCKREDATSAICYLDQMYEDGIKPTPSVYEPILSCLFNMKKVHDAQDMFVRMLEDGIDPDEVVYVTMINGLSKNGKAYAARQYFDRMVQQGIQPSARAYTAFMYGLVKRNMITKNYLDRMLEEGFVPNNVFFTSVISQFLRRGELEYSLRLMDLMDRSGIERDRVMYIALLSGVLRNIARRTPTHILFMSNRSKRMRELLFNFLKCSVVLRQPSIREIRYNLTGEMKYLAERLMQEIRDNGYLPCLYLYNCIMYKFCSENKMREAEDHLDSMQDKGVSPNHVTFTILINGHISRGEIDRALRLFKKVKKMPAYGCQPDRVMYNALIRGLCKVRLRDALSLSALMQKQGMLPGKDCYQRLRYATV